MIHQMLDTSSEVKILPTDLYDSLKLRDSTLQPTTTGLQGYFGGKVMPKGQKRLCEMKNKTYSLIFKILDKGKPVLSKEACETLGLLQRVPVYTMIKPDGSFEGTGCLQGSPVHIKLTDTATPYFVTAPCRSPLPMLPQLKEEMGKMEQGIINRITEPTDWCAPIVIVPKKNNKMRVCVDLRQLNKAVAREPFTQSLHLRRFWGKSEECKFS